MSLGIEDLTSDHIAAWRHHPVTKVIHKYILDFVRSIEIQTIYRLRAGTMTAEWAAEAAAKISAFEEIVVISFEEMRDFYGVTEPKETESDAAEIS